MNTTPVQIVDAGSDLTVYSLEGHAAALRAALASASRIIVELRDVSACDSMGIQLLIAARRSAERLGKALVCANAPVTVVRAATAVGCEPHTFTPVSPTL